MSQQKAAPSKIISPEFRLAFANIYTPKAFGTGKPKYSFTMLFPKATTDLSQIKQALVAALNEKWPDPARRPKNLVNPIKDGDTDIMDSGELRKDKYPEVAGHWLINASSLQRIGLCDENIQPILDESTIYSGCWCRASLRVFAFAPTKDNPQSKYGLGFGVNNLMKVRDDEPFSGRSSAYDDFAAYAEATGAAGVKANSDDFGDMFN